MRKEFLQKNIFFYFSSLSAADAYQGDQMSLRKKSPKMWPSPLMSKLAQTAQKFWVSSVIFQKLPKEKNRAMGENSPNRVALNCLPPLFSVMQSLSSSSDSLSGVPTVSPSSIFRTLNRREPFHTSPFAKPTKTDSIKLAERKMAKIAFFCKLRIKELVGTETCFFFKFASPKGRIYFHQSIQYSYKVGKYCINSSSPPERVGIYFSGLGTEICRNELLQFGVLRKLENGVKLEGRFDKDQTLLFLRTALKGFIESAPRSEGWKFEAQQRAKEKSDSSKAKHRHQFANKCQTQTVLVSRVTRLG
jgi:hypothetical protein